MSREQRKFFNMKKLLIALVLIVAVGITVNAESMPVNGLSYTPGITFRTIQKLRDSDGFEMYLKTNHVIEMYDHKGAPAGTGTWKIEGGELYFYSNSGTLIRKCPCKVSNGELQWVKFDGSTYYKVR